MAVPLRVLLFEDSQADAELLLRELRRGGYEPFHRRVYTPEAAREALQSESWSLIVSDYSMPRFSALDALEILQRSRLDIPFIVVSGTIGEDVAVTTMKRGAHDYFIKGNLTRLTAAVERELREAEERRKRKGAEEALQRERESLQAEVVQRRRSEERLSVQYACALALAESTSLAEAASRILKAIGEVLEWEVGELWQVDRQTSLLRFVEIWHSPTYRFPQLEQVSREMTFARGMGLPGRVWASARAISIQDVAKDPNLPRARVAVQEGLRAAFGFPIMLREEVLGVMDFFSREIWEPDDDIVTMLSTVGSQMGQFIGRKRSEREVIQRAPVAALAADVAVALIQPGNLQERLQRCAEAIVKHIDAAFARIWTLNEADQILELQASAGLYTHVDGSHSRVPVGKYKIGLIAQERQPHLTNDVLNDPRVGDREWAAREGMVAFAGHPLIAHDRLVGVMALFAKHRLSEVALTALATIADNVALGIEGRRVEVEREKMEMQFRQAQKMEAVGRLAGGIAHDFNNLLTAITGYGELMLPSLKEGERLRSNLEEVLKAAHRAAALTRQLLAFSRRQVLEPKVLDLNAVVVGILPMLRRLIGEDVDLVNVPDPGLGHVKADPGQIEQVIVNLAVNARDAMPGGGKLILETMNVDLDEVYARQHVAVRPGRFVMLAVSDTGVGMDEKTKASIFEPFFTTKEKGKGTGLGLATVYGIVKQSGGYIWVYSEPGRGTTFKIYLPRVNNEIEHEESAKPLQVAAHGSETVLVVEDEEIVRSLTRQILQARGYAVLEAQHGPEALRVCELHKGEIHLILTDVVLPHMSGPELAARVATLRPQIKLLYMSGYTGNALAHLGVPDVEGACLQKPFTLASLARKVREVLDAPSDDGIKETLGRT
jgi:signal transduction histidine kinase/DNA-binding response OmpR family regulator